jgi:hypothetical protein
MGKPAGTIPVAVLVAMGLMVGPMTAGATTTIGETFRPTEICGGPATYLQEPLGGKYAAPSAGVITSWSIQLDNPAQMRLRFKVGREIAEITGGFIFTIVGDGPLVTPVPAILNTFPVQIPVQRNDVIGLYVAISNAKNCGFAGLSGSRLLAGPSADPAPGSQAPYFPTSRNLDLSATLETTPCQGKPPTDAGTTGADKLTGTAEADVMVGLGGKDTITGSSGNDVICGGAGKDALKGGGGKDVCIGGKGKDTASKCEVEKSI